MNAIELREPMRPETRIGWWFMRHFRRSEVARRGTRNEILGAAYTFLLRYDNFAAHGTPEAGRMAADARDRLVRAFDAYDSLDAGPEEGEDG